MTSLRPRQRRVRCLVLSLAAFVSLLASQLGGFGDGAQAQVASPTAGATPTAADTPVLAYYYIWFDVRSWRRAKTDYPRLGRYSSDERAVMRQHVRWAKEAGIDGFIVSWKNTETLSLRLEALVEIAEEEDFKLAIIYQGLDFERKPIEAERIADDLDYFQDTYGHNPVFNIFGRPLVIWSGTWEFSPEEIASVTETRRDGLLILASERNAADYLTKAALVDGNAYYWSSVNPDTFPGYPEKLQGMAAAVHDNEGLWIAPAAPGFDARLIGGERFVERQDGAMLRRQFEAAMTSSPDAVGLISWNEFSENSHVEPSCKYGTRELAVVAELLGGAAPSSVPDRCTTAIATETTAASPEAGEARPPTRDVAEPTLDLTREPTTVEEVVEEPTRTPWPTAPDAANFVTPVRPDNNNSDFDSSVPAATDRSIGRVALLGVVALFTIVVVMLVAVRSLRIRMEQRSAGAAHDDSSARAITPADQDLP